MIPLSATSTTPVFCFIIGGDMHTNPHWPCEWQCAGHALIQFTLNGTKLALFLPNDAIDPVGEVETVHLDSLAFPEEVRFRRVRSRKTL